MRQTESCQRSRCLSLYVLVILSCSLSSASRTSLAAELSALHWRMDLEYLARQMPQVHRNAFHAISKEQFEREVAQLSKRLSSMTESEIRAGFQRIVVSIGDIHTFASSIRGNEKIPILHRRFGRDIYAIGATSEYSAVIGARLVGIDSNSIEKVVDRLRSLVRLETTQMLDVDLPGLLHFMDSLRGTGVWGAGNSAMFHYERGGQTFSIEVKPVPGRTFIPSNIENVPMYESDRTAYWFRLLRDAHVLYIQYNDCKNLDSLPFAQFTRQVVNAATHNPIEKVIIDLRHNQGGKSEVIKPLFKALKADPLVRARLYVITSPWTLSSGTSAACELKTRFKAVVVGEPSGQKLHSYGDSRIFKLPQSGISVFYSTKFYDIVPGKEDLLIPDLIAPITAIDFFAGRDSALERILAN